MDLSNYNFYASDCARKLDEIEAALGVKFDRKAMFDREQALWVQLNQDWARRQWVFKFSKDPSVTTATFDDREPGETGITETETHIEYAPHSMIYAKDALLCSLKCLNDKIPDIQARRKPKPPEKQMTPQDKETHMHETIARASLVAFAEFIGQPISDLDATLRQARGLYGREGKKLAVVVKIPVDKTKPIEASVVDSQGVHDGVTSGDGVVTLSYWPLADSSSAKSLRASTGGMLQFTKDTTERLTTERAKLTPPPPKPEPIPLEAECRAHVKTLNAQLGINLNEDVVLAAGEAVRGAKDDAKTQHNVNYTLTIRKSDRAASFCAIIGDECESVNEKGFVVYSCNFIGCDNGLECALSKMESKIPKILKELTQQPSVSQHDMMTATERLDSALEVRLTQYVIYIFHTASGKIESTKRTTDADNFSAMLSSGQPRLYLAFKNKQDRSEGGRVTAHVSTKPLSESGFDVTISAEIVTSSPLDTISRLIESITKANL